MAINYSEDSTRRFYLAMDSDLVQSASSECTGTYQSHSVITRSSRRVSINTRRRQDRRRKDTTKNKQTCPRRVGRQEQSSHGFNSNTKHPVVESEEEEKEKKTVTRSRTSTIESSNQKQDTRSWYPNHVMSKRRRERLTRSNDEQLLNL